MCRAPTKPLSLQAGGSPHGGATLCSPATPSHPHFPPRVHPPLRPSDYTLGTQNRPLITGLGIPLGCKLLSSGRALSDCHSAVCNSGPQSDFPCILHTAFHFILKKFRVCIYVSVCECACTEATRASSSVRGGLSETGSSWEPWTCIFSARMVSKPQRSLALACLELRL